MIGCAWIAAAGLLCIAGSGRAARPADAPEARQLALVVRLDAVAGQRPAHVADPSAAPGLVVGLVGVPAVEGTRCTFRFVITNLTDRVAYNPRVRLERRAVQRGAALLSVPLAEGSLGLAAGSISQPVLATLDVASLDVASPGAAPGQLLAIAESSPAVAGSVGVHGAGPGAFSKPRGLAIDPKGRLVVADRGNHRVQVLTADGRPLHAWGRLGSEPGEFDHPEDVEIDARTGRIHVCDMNNARIQVLSPQGKHLASWPTDGTELNHPADLALSPDGPFLYVADAGNSRIVRLDSNGRLAGTWGEFGEGPGQFRAILDVETDAQGRVYVSDGASATVQVFTGEGRLVGQVGGGPGRGRIRYPTAILPLPGDRLLVADFADDRVMAFKLDGEFLGEFGRVGKGLGDFQYPNDLALDGSLLFVSQTASDTITIFDLRGWQPFDDASSNRVVNPEAGKRVGLAESPNPERASDAAANPAVRPHPRLSIAPGPLRPYNPRFSATSGRSAAW